ncbi:MAG: ABC transporter ATP-binding protein [Candidatus Heimdallarchaeota archaeon]|nr:ABC transporter ATP-binding protein [Candidatus Heimdallarchaeota archaeon]
MNQEAVIEVSNLQKSINSEIILSNISFDVYKGELFSFLGPDGSGKSTIFDILVGLRKPTDGKITILGYNRGTQMEMREIKKVIGVLPQEFRTHDNLTVKENILFWGKMYDKMLDINELLDKFKLTDKSNTRYRKLPMNLRRRVGLAIAFVNNPKIVFLDEPTTGLDQFAKKEVWEILLDFKKQGTTIFITTNQAIEPQVLADRVAIIHKGIIKDIGTPIELIDRYSSSGKVIIRFTSNDDRSAAIQTLQSDCPIEIVNDNIEISSDEITLLEILAKLDKANIRYSDLITQKPTLNDVFITLTGEKLDSI